MTIEDLLAIYRKAANQPELPGTKAGLIAVTRAVQGTLLDGMCLDDNKSGHDINVVFNEILASLPGMEEGVGTRPRPADGGDVAAVPSPSSVNPCRRCGGLGYTTSRRPMTGQLVQEQCQQCEGRGTA